jgi:hypothetical protein
VNQPIGFIHVSDPSWRSASNPLGYRSDFLGEPDAFAEKVVDRAKAVGAGCVVIWDGEGQQHNHPVAAGNNFGAVSYVGDPRQCHPAVQTPLAEKLLAAGLRTGVTLRPTLCVTGPNYPMQVAGDPYTILADKIQWAKWVLGASVYYVDTNVRPGPWPPRDGKARLVTANTFTRLRADFPGDLYVPEIHDSTYYAVPGVLPYVQWRVGKQPPPKPAKCALMLMEYDERPVSEALLAAAFKAGAVPFVDCVPAGPEYDAKADRTIALYLKHRTA